MSFKKFKIKESTLLCYSLIYFLFIINVIFNMKSMYLWQDESFTYHIIQHSFSNIVYLTSLDVHPFLYYFIAKILVSPFHTLVSRIIALRVVSALPYLILLIIGNTTIKHRFSNTVAILFMFSIMSMPVLVQNIYQIRMYGWAMLFTAIVFILFDYISKNILSNSFITSCIISLFALLASYTHYYALITVAIIYILFLVLFLINHTKIRYLLISALIDILFYVPQLYILSKQTKSVTQSYWSQPITLRLLIKYTIGVFNPVQNKDIFLIFGLLIALVLLCLVIKTWDISLLTEYIGITLPFIIILIAFILSLIVGHTVLQPRFIAPAMSIFWLCISVILAKLLRNKHNIYNKFNAIILGLIIILGLGSYADNLHQTNTATHLFSTAFNSYQRIPKNSVIIYNNSIVMYSSSSYLSNNKVLSQRPKDLSYPVYKKVFNNISNQNTCKLPNKKNIFFISINKQGRHQDNTTESRLNNKFVKDHRHQMTKLSNINLINDGGKSTIYKISK